jgi:riboflavin kinase/FMN adenylyltransferase
MKISRSLTKYIPESVITIGNFDGIHLGHQAIFNRVKEIALKKNKQSVVITFENHPKTVLKPDNPTASLCTIKHKLKLIEGMGIDQVILLPFTKDFAKQSADEFLQKVLNVTHFSDLILGEDAAIGRDREGNKEMVGILSSKFGFKVEYIPHVKLEGKRISSTSVRELVTKGLLEEAANFLGRPYSIYETVIKGLGLGKKLTYPTANLDVSNLCLPPFGVYVAELIFENQHIQGVANLGIAPTVRYNNKPVLEIHLFNFDQDLYGKDVEVMLHHYIRPEIRFENIDQLIEKISEDVSLAQNYFTIKKGP